MRFSAVILPNAANSTASSPHAEAGPHSRPRRGVRSQRRGPQMDRLHGGAGKRLAQIGGDARVVDGDEPRRAHHDAQHRPAVVDRTAEPRHRVFDDVALAPRDGRTRTRAGSRRTAPAAAAPARARDAAARRAARPAREMRRDSPTCSRGTARCRADRRQDRRDRGAPSRGSRGRFRRRSSQSRGPPRAAGPDRRCRPQCPTEPAAAARTRRGARVNNRPGRRSQSQSSAAVAVRQLGLGRRFGGATAGSA